MDRTNYKYKVNIKKLFVGALSSDRAEILDRSPGRFWRAGRSLWLREDETASKGRQAEVDFQFSPLVSAEGEAKLKGLWSVMRETVVLRCARRA